MKLGTNIGKGVLAHITPMEWHNIKRMCSAGKCRTIAPAIAARPAVARAWLGVLDECRGDAAAAMEEIANRVADNPHWPKQSFGSDTWSETYAAIYWATCDICEKNDKGWFFILNGSHDNGTRCAACHNNAPRKV